MAQRCASCAKDSIGHHFPACWIWVESSFSENRITPLLGVPPFSIKHPPRRLQPSKSKLTPSKMQIGNPIKRDKITQKSSFPPSLVGGCQFACWRPKLSWGCLPYGEKSLHTYILCWNILFYVISCNTLRKHNWPELHLCSILPVTFSLSECPLQPFFAHLAGQSENPLHKIDGAQNTNIIWGT